MEAGAHPPLPHRWCPLPGRPRASSTATAPWASLCPPCCPRVPQWTAPAAPATTATTTASCPSRRCLWRTIRHCSCWECPWARDSSPRLRSTPPAYLLDPLVKTFAWTCSRRRRPRAATTTTRKVVSSSTESTTTRPICRPTAPQLCHRVWASGVSSPTIRSSTGDLWVWKADLDSPLWA